MLTYTFTRREKALILVFALLLVAIAWFWFVYQNTTNAMYKIDEELTTVQSEIDIQQARLTQMNSMAQVVEQRKAEGAKKTVMPVYDNLQPLMTQLNSIMSKADSFTLSFDQLDRENPEYVMRGVRIDYTCDSYKKAEAIVKALAGGDYPCSIDTVAISDPNAGKSATSTSGIGWSTTTKDGKVQASVHVTFFESLPAGSVPAADSADSQAAA